MALFNESSFGLQHTGPTLDRDMFTLPYPTLLVVFDVPDCLPVTGNCEALKFQ